MTCKVYCPTAIEQEIGVVPVEGYNPYFFPAEGAYLPFFFTEDSFLRVLSSLVNGAAITYGDEGRAVVWEFLRNVEFPMSLCQAIADCINDPLSPARQAIVDLVLSDPEIAAYIAQQAQRLSDEALYGNLIAGDCDEGVVAGRVIQLINRLDENNTDFLEILEIGTNDEERTADLLEAIPILGELPIGDIIQIAQDFLEDFAENYAAASTFERRDKLARDLWCVALESPDCALTYAQVFEYFQEEAATPLTIATTLLQISEFLATGDFSDDDILFRAMFAFQVSYILVGSEFNGMTVPTIGSLMRDALPSTRWLEWDPCDAPPTDCLDFKVSRHGWLAGTAGGVEDPAYGQWILGEGFAPAASGTFFVFAPIEADKKPTRFIASWEGGLISSITFGELGFAGELYIPPEPTATIEVGEAEFPTIFPIDMDLYKLYISPPGNVFGNLALRLVEICYFYD